MLTKQSILATGIFLFCILLFTSIAFSQNKEKPSGYYISLRGDTVKGIFMNYKEWSNSPSNVVFMPAGSDKTIKLAPANCSFFSINGYDSYIAYSGNRLTNSIDFNGGMDEADSTDQLEPVTAFLRIIFNNNEFKLAMLSDRKRTNFFYQVNGQPFVELICKSFTNPTNSAYVELTTYKNQLHGIFSKKMDEGKLKNKLNELKYGESSLLNFLQNVYDVTEDKKIKKHYRNSYYATAGIALNSFNVTGDADAHEIGLKYSNTISPVLNCGMIIPLHRNFGRLSFSPQLKLFSFKSSGTYNGLSGLLDTATYTFRNDLTIALSVYFGYNLIQNKSITWRLAAGPGFDKLINNKEIANMAYYPTLTTPLSGLSVLFNIQTAIIFNQHLMILADYTLPSTITDFVLFSGSYSSFQVSAGWSFQ